MALQSLMELYPGSEVVSEDTLRIAPGVEISMPADQPRNQRVLSKKAVAAQLAATKPVRPAPPVPPQGPTTKLAERESLAAAGGTYLDCAYEYLCLYQNASYGGYKIRFYTCAFMDLGKISFPTGGHWNDKITSFINNQTPGTVSHFYNWNGSTSNWDKKFSSEAFWFDPNIGPSYGANDIIDGIRVC
ncbi:peptidase inhibitor family I36 protein [Micromonospora chalcea]|uniref:peptidase inhibitor family I36 protein n=1 Tax=Micromonospora chalcea TaxID=1874 RepID=UPI0021A511F4|nr:peptidase inhibitor family I36 protein [Micromonospora chalcea]MCT2278083.1 peptidase inhibitor family I36 protein [Micromonospora chalcea]